MIDHVYILCIDSSYEYTTSRVYKRFFGYDILRNFIFLTKETYKFN